MSKVTLKYSGLGPVSLSNKAGGVITIKPGVGELQASDWAEMKKQKDVESMLHRGEHEGVGPDNHDRKTGLGNLKVISEGKSESTETETETETEGEKVPGNQGDAKKLVAETEDTHLLKKWLESESRAGVKNSIEKKLKEIEDYREEHGEKED